MDDNSAYDTVRSIIAYCGREACTPATIVFDDGKSFDDLDDIVDNWNRPHSSFLAAEVIQDPIVLGLKNILTESGDAPHGVDVPAFDRLTNFYEILDDIISKFVPPGSHRPRMTMDSYNVCCSLEKVDLDDLFLRSTAQMTVRGSERKLLSHTEYIIPEWFFAPQDRSVMKIRSLGVDMTIKKDCLFYAYEDGKKNRHVVETIPNILGVTVKKREVSRLRAMIVIGTKKPWKRHILADIITNEKHLCHIMSIQEERKLLSERRIMTVVCAVSKFDVMEWTDRGVRVRLHSSKDRACLKMMALLVESVFAIYDKLYDIVNATYDVFVNSDDTCVVDITRSTCISGLYDLKQAVPDLFIEGYSRECRILPIIVPESEAEYTDSIYYFGRYYAVPRGYYVGLKANRLSNNDKYPYLVTAYETDHRHRPRSSTYKYLNGVVKNRKEGLSFLECIGLAFDAPRMSGRVHPDVCSQEAWWDLNPDLESNVDGDLFFRYFEELYDCNIIIVRAVKGSHDISIPEHNGDYYWSRHPSNDGLIMVKSFSPYHIHSGRDMYALVPNDVGGYIHDIDRGGYCADLLRMKASITKRGILPPTGTAAVGQAIDNHGKCVAVEDENGNRYRCMCRPFNAPRLSPVKGVIVSHLERMNAVRSLDNLGSVQWKSTNERYLYFPDLDSFLVWWETASG